MDLSQNAYVGNDLCVIPKKRFLYMHLGRHIGRPLQSYYGFICNNGAVSFILSNAIKLV